MSNCRRKSAYVPPRFEEASKLAVEHGLELVKINNPSGADQYRLSGNGWYKELYPSVCRICCPEKSRQGPFIAMRGGQKWSLVDVVKACIKAIESQNKKSTAPKVPPPGEPIDIDVEIFLLLSILEAIKGNDSDENDTTAMESVLSDLRHIATYRGVDFDQAIEASESCWKLDLRDSDDQSGWFDKWETRKGH